MPRYVAIVEDAGRGKAVGIWFPDHSGCFSAGDDIDEALRNAQEALEPYAARRRSRAAPFRFHARKGRSARGGRSAQPCPRLDRITRSGGGRRRVNEA